MNFAQKISVFAILASICIAGCKPDKPKVVTDGTDTGEAKKEIPAATRPRFSGDTAYLFVKKQVDFGPRMPGSSGHALCAQYLYTELKKYADNVILQQGQMQTWDNKTLTIKNIIGEINPTAQNRILLFAHWDTRPWADEDIKNTDMPILGANDGGSGVGVLMEVARQLHLKKPTWGVDIIFFDAEDWGKGEYPDSYCLGSQYWGKNPHKKDYKAQYGILLDMVGAGGATFPQEGYSLRTAQWVVSKVWGAASALGHYPYFLNGSYGEITDDHVYVNKLTGIPSIDIIHTNPPNVSGRTFGHFWHTHADNMQVIDKNTLQAVGETLLYVVYSEK